MVGYFTRIRPVYAAIWLFACAGSVVSARSHAQTQRISQTRINEYAATLLRAHRVLIEDPGLRRPGEQLSPYMHRIAAPLPGESEALYRARIAGYVTNVEKQLDRRLLCITVPALTDTDPQNTAVWRKATAASAELPGHMEQLRTAWASVKSGPIRRTVTDRLAVELDHMLIAIKTAFESFRDARP
jgi:hypothetical protein